MTGDDAVLDRPVWTALRGLHRRFAVSPSGLANAEVLAVRYQPEVAGFAALSDIGNPEAWAQLALLTGPSDRVGLFGTSAIQPPPGWAVTDEVGVAQLTYSAGSSAFDAQLGRPWDELVSLTRADVPQMLELVELTRPGPFFHRTVDFGGYLGIRRNGQLVAMAGRRFQLPGWVELSAVCTHPDHRGQGLSRRLIDAVIQQIVDDGQRPFLHVTQDNPAAAIYHRRGFSHRIHAVITVLKRAGEGR